MALSSQVVQTARTSLALVAAAGVLACWLVAQAWPTGRRPEAVAAELALFTLISAGVLTLAMVSPRPAAVSFSLLLLGYGWLGTWAYGFLWVPGAAAMLACLLPRPTRGARAVDPPLAGL